MTRVSIIIPTYNREDTLPRAIDSVTDQTINDIEIIVIDDGSTDNTREIVESYAIDNIKYIKFGENRGANAARKAGVESAQGEFIAFLDSDDEWHPLKLEKQIKEFESSSSRVGVVYTGVKYVNERGNTIGKTIQNINGNVLKQILCDNIKGIFSSGMIRSDTIKRVGLPDENFDSGQDWEYFTRLAQDYRFKCIPQVLVNCYTTHENRISRSHIPEDKYVAYQKKFRHIINRFNKFEQRRIYSCHMFGLSQSNIQNDNYLKAGKYIILSIYRYPFDIRYYVYLASILGGKYTYQPLQNMKRTIAKIFD